MEDATIKLRALEPDDLNFLYQIENDTNNWKVSETKIPFSKYLLYQYLENLGEDITKTGQLRLVIEDKNTKDSLGLIDLFDFDSINKRSGVGIIVNPKSRELGVGGKALRLLRKYSKDTLNLHQLYCEIQSDNTKSISFFEKNGFKHTGTKKDWTLSNKEYSDVLFFQKIL